MIDLRYHIVSLMAVFLALGLGILLGSSVVRDPLEAQLHANLERANQDRNDAIAQRNAIEDERDDLAARLTGQIAPWALNGRLDGGDIVVVSDGSEVPEWREHVLDTLVAAGADPAGTIVLTERWELPRPEDTEELVRTVTGVVPSFEPGGDAGVATLDLLGERLVEPTGRSLIEELADAGFLNVQGAPDDDAWPTASTFVIVLSAARTGDSRPTPGAAAFASSAATVAPTLVASDVPTGRSVVTQLRQQEDLPAGLSTFDAATNDNDPGGIGVAAAMLAAVEARGGHFGTQDGRTFVAPAAPEP